MQSFLQHLLKNEKEYIELRFQNRKTLTIVAQKSRLDVLDQDINEGIGVRALVQGKNGSSSWGFASTSDVSEKAISHAIEQAKKNAKILSEEKHATSFIELAKNVAFPEKTFLTQNYVDLSQMPVEQKIEKIIALEQQLKNSSKMLNSSRCRYQEILIDKTIVTSDGVCVSMQNVWPEISCSALAEQDGQRASMYKGAGVSGNWACLFSHPTLDNLIEDTSRLAVDLLKAPYPEGGRKKVILAPALVGLLCHEAIGHTVEADFVNAGSIARGKIGHKVASNLVTLCDSGLAEFGSYAVGVFPIDDEGVPTQKTTIIKDGVLTSYLHNRQTAAEYKVAPTGNARAWDYDDEPLIRMRNTYIMPGQKSLAELLFELDNGYLIEGAGSGQADANGEFMFGSTHMWEIKKGKKTRLIKEATVSGQAFDVLKSINGVSKEFSWDLGTGFCGKGQPAKVDAGGPYISCEINIGGEVDENL